MVSNEKNKHTKEEIANVMTKNTRTSSDQYFRLTQFTGFDGNSEGAPLASSNIQRGSLNPSEEMINGPGQMKNIQIYCTSFIFHISSFYFVFCGTLKSLTRTFSF